MATRPELEGLAHGHASLGPVHDENARRTLWVVALTSVMMIGEIVAGYLTGSMALLADGFHMATHAGALGVAAAAYRYARRHAENPLYSFGTGKVGDLAGFASALVLGLIALGIAIESLVRLMNPVSVAFGDATLVAVIGLAVNIASAFLLSGGHDHHDHTHGHHHHHHEPRPGATERHRDNNFRSAYVHVIADALTSVLAIVALLAGRYLGWVWLDPVIGIVGALVIASWSWTLMRDTAAVLLDTADSHLMEEVREKVEAPGDAKIVDLHIWRIGPGANAAIVSVHAPGRIDSETVRRRLASVPELIHVTVECR
jgi:cation diffusion facilitator family transporter